MLSSLRSRLWLSYAFIIVMALGVVTIVLFVSLLRSPLAYRKTVERLKAAQVVLLEQSGEPDAPPISELAERNAERFGARVIVFDRDREVVYDTSSPEAAALAFPEKKTLLKNSPIARDAAGTAWLVAIAQLPDGSFVMTAVPRPRLSILSLFGDEFMPSILFSGAVAFLLSLVVAFLVSGWIASPLQGIIGAAREMPSAEIQPVETRGPHEVQELTRAFNSMAARVQASQKSQREFVANVSHEMKTPLTSIQGFAQALLDGTANTEEARQKAARIIYDESERMRRMVANLLDLAKLDAGSADLKMSPVDVSALLNSIAEKFAPQSARAGVNIEVDAESNLPPLVADGDRLAQVFTNLVDNALKFTPQGGKVTMRASLVSNAMRISVSDTGAGMSKDELPRIFERFYRADPSRAGGESHGAGLGLAIAREIVAAHGGRISVQSEAGLGATMEVILPLTA